MDNLAVQNGQDLVSSRESIDFHFLFTSFF